MYGTEVSLPILQLFCLNRFPSEKLPSAKGGQRDTMNYIDLYIAHASTLNKDSSKESKNIGNFYTLVLLYEKSVNKGAESG